MIQKLFCSSQMHLGSVIWFRQALLTFTRQDRCAFYSTSISFIAFQPVQIRRKNYGYFTGAGVAIVTPMHENGDVNYEKLSEILEEQIAGGTDAIIICGTTGESSTLTHEEHLDVIRYTVEKVAKRIPVIAGTGSNCTATAIYLSQEAEKAGADALLLVTPYYNKATQNGLIAHYTAIAESVKLPIVLYNVPSRTGCNIQPQTAVYLAKM